MENVKQITSLPKPLQCLPIAQRTPLSLLTGLLRMSIPSSAFLSDFPLAYCPCGHRGPLSFSNSASSSCLRAWSTGSLHGQMHTPCMASYPSILSLNPNVTSPGTLSLQSGTCPACPSISITPFTCHNYSYFLSPPVQYNLMVAQTLSVHAVIPPPRHIVSTQHSTHIY